MIENKMGFFYEEYSIGQVFEHAISKTITEADNSLFCSLTCNMHPVHINNFYAKNEQHGRILVVGTLVFSLTVGLTVMDISGKAIANLDYEDIKHLNPVFIGDTIYARSRIIDKKDSRSKKDRGILYVETIGYNQNDQEVISFRRHILIKRNLIIDEE